MIYSKLSTEKQTPIVRFSSPAKIFTSHSSPRTPSTSNEHFHSSIASRCCEIAKASKYVCLLLFLSAIILLPIFLGHKNTPSDPKPNTTHIMVPWLWAFSIMVSFSFILLYGYYNENTRK